MTKLPLLLSILLATSASAGVLSVLKNGKVDECTISGNTVISPKGDIKVTCESDGPVQPPTPTCQKPPELILNKFGSINDYNGEQNLLYRGRYDSYSFVMPNSTNALAYFSFVEIEQTAKEAKRLATISKCPGDFKGMLPKCYSYGNTFSLYGSSNGMYGCKLNAGEKYYLNVRMATPRIYANGVGDGEKLSDDTCPVGQRCGFSVSARFRQ